MILTMHTLNTMHCNVLTEIRLASETGHDGLEIIAAKLVRYLDQGLQAEDLTPIFTKYGVRPICINPLAHIERNEESARKQLMTEAERLSTAAQAIKCPTIQLLPSCALEGRPWKDVLALTARNVAEIADIGRQYVIRFQIEPVAWAPIHSLSQTLELIQKSGRDNVGLLIDFWHLWAGEETSPDEVVKLNPSIIYGVHFCDGKRIPKDRPWTEGEVRGYLPGDGDVPIKDWTTAVKATGYDGSWSPELFSPRHWEWDLEELTLECKSRMLQYLSDSP